MTDTRITDFEAVAPMPIYTQADLDAAVQKEREACAQICEGHMMPFTHCKVSMHAVDMTVVDLARVIRARSQHD